MLPINIRNLFRTSKAFVNPIFIDKRILRKPPYPAVLSRIITCPEKEFVYIRIPKAANSTVTTLLWNQLNGTCFDAKIPTKKIKKSFPKATNLNLYKSFIAKKKYFFFTIVRNPYDRVLSAYLQKFSTPLYVERYKSIISKEKKTSFQSFCHFLDQGGLYKDAHWIPQYDFMWPSCERLNYIGKFETLHEDIDRTFHIIFGKCNVNTNIFYGPERKYASKLREEFYNEYCKKIISRLYQNDFLKFNYSFDLFHSI